MEGGLDRTATEAVIKVFLREIHERLDKAVQIAMAAAVYASAGTPATVCRSPSISNNSPTRPDVCSMPQAA